MENWSMVRVPLQRYPTKGRLSDILDMNSRSPRLRMLNQAGVAFELYEINLQCSN